MEEDNLAPNDGTWFGIGEPTEQIIARKKERALTLEALPVLKDLVKRLKARIEFYNSMDSIDDDIKLDVKKFMVVYNANKLTRDNLQVELARIEGLIEDHAPR